MSRKPYPSELADKVLVRLPDGMKVKLLESAHANNRSLSAEVVARLEASLSKDKPSGQTQRLTFDDLFDQVLAQRLLTEKIYAAITADRPDDPKPLRKLREEPE